jgi:hypothetical protein
MSAPQSGTCLDFQIDEIHSFVTDNAFVVVYVSQPSIPTMWTIQEPASKHFELVTLAHNELLFIIQLYCTRQNDDGYNISQYLGACVLDVSQLQKKTYHLSVRDVSKRKPLHVGQVSITFTNAAIQRQKLTAHQVQSPHIVRQLYTAAEANLQWIRGFGQQGMAPIVKGLRLVHSPYYVNFLGMTLPSGAFCMLSARYQGNRKAALQSYEERLVIALARNTVAAPDFVDTVRDMMTSTIKSKHLRCLAVVADFLTLHTRIQIRYSPDVRLTPTPKGTERWELPREPMPDGTISFNGDCEDYAREIYQHCKELRAWITPNVGASAIESVVAILNMYVPTIEQGAVDKSAHSKYITYQAAYRNHIWAALHPRVDWITKCEQTFDLRSLYEIWPPQKCEKTLPMIHLEGTGDVYPVVTMRKPGYIAKMQNKNRVLVQLYPELTDAETPDITLQCDHRSTFYKYPIACMTDIFADQGVLDFTYVSHSTYGVSIYHWARGKYRFRPSCVHSKETMQQIRDVLSVERPIPVITSKSRIVEGHGIKEGYSLRYGQPTPFNNIPTGAQSAVYDVGGQKWYELYFTISSTIGSASSTDVVSTSDTEITGVDSRLLLI